MGMYKNTKKKIFLYYCSSFIIYIQYILKEYRSIPNSFILSITIAKCLCVSVCAFDLQDHSNDDDIWHVKKIFFLFIEFIHKIFHYHHNPVISLPFIRNFFFRILISINISEKKERKLG